MDQIYLINLEKSKDRLEHFQKEMKRCNLPKVTVFKAIDGESHIFTKEEEKMVGKIKDNFVKACFLSHYYVLKDIEKNKYRNCLILEDDVRFVHDIVDRLHELISHLDMNWYIVFVGTHLIASGSYFIDFPIETVHEHSFYSEKINEYICRYKNDFNPCALAYLVNGSNVTEIIEEMEKNPEAVDHCYNTILKRKKYFLWKFTSTCNWK